MITAIAVDSDPLSMEVMSNYCKQTGFIDLKESFSDLNSALEAIRKNPADLLLVNTAAANEQTLADITTLDAMLILVAVGNEPTVSHSNNIIDYITKPLKYNRFLHAAEKALELFYYRLAKQGNSQHLYIRADYCMQKITLADIKYIEGMDNYIKIHLQNSKPLLVRMSMKGVTEKLPEHEFVRIHRSYIVASSKITTIKNKAVHIGNLELPIGLNYADKVLSTFAR